MISKKYVYVVSYGPDQARATQNSAHAISTAYKIAKRRMTPRDRDHHARRLRKGISCEPKPEVGGGYAVARKVHLGVD